ncbi:isoprenyl transferase [Persicirhabdus sediminis]|uniref:Isoprenyl transferase n=1 Tax=Persicirhabdus sediminis TaxID=454144 RepID=A0A8J7SL63_9BACT|nr:isoprenyl transferase [Persicirhabdus sediminis]MBK1792176.1 isoprenyl transferase [Persicirhabdus sediminis]
MSELNSNVPRHIAVIMDGNGRWANERGLPRRDGHRAGAESVREAVDACRELGVEYLTLYAFSSENWKRPKAEVEALMSLLEKFLKDKLPEMLKQNVRLHAIGQLDRLPAKCRKQIDKSINKTASNTGLNLVLALSYGAREEIVDAAKQLAQKVADGELAPEQIDNQLFASHLYTADFPDPDLMIRTSGELRVSNFLLWQISYAELVISQKFWPDFRAADMHAAVAEYGKRNRRFGELK